MLNHNNNLYESTFSALIRPFARNTKRTASHLSPQKRLLSQRTRDSLPLVRENNFVDNLMSKMNQDLDNHFSLMKSSFNDVARDPFESTRSIWKDFNTRSSIKEEADKYIIELNEPGLAADTLNVNYLDKNNVLTIQAAKEVINNAEGFQSSSYSSYQNNYTLGKPVDFLKASREVDGDKILITVPKTNVDKIEQIEDSAHDNADANESK